MKRILKIIFAVTVSLFLVFLLIVGISFAAYKIGPQLGTSIWFISFFAILLSGLIASSFYLGAQHICNTNEVLKHYLKSKAIGITGKSRSSYYKGPKGREKIVLWGWRNQLYGFAYLGWALFLVIKDINQMSLLYISYLCLLAILGGFFGYRLAKAWLWKDPASEKSIKRTPFVKFLQTKI